MTDHGRIPGRGDLHVQRGFPFRYSMVLQDGSTWPTAPEFRFDSGQVWTSTVTGDTATWDIPAVTVDEPSREEHVRLVLGDVLWEEGRLRESSTSGLGGRSMSLVLPNPGGGQVITSPAIKGDRGEPGPTGDTGPAGAPGGSDEATAAWVYSGTLTRAAIDEAIAESPTLAAAVTINEVPLTSRLAHGDITTRTTMTLIAAPYPSIADQFSLVCGADVTASATDYWVVALIRVRFGVETVIASKATQGANGITAFQAWDFNTVEFSEYAVMAAGDVLIVRLTAVGSPDPITDPLVTFRVPPTSEPSPPNPSPAVTLLADTFDRADSATELGGPETGGPWVAEDPTTIWGVRSNRAYIPEWGTPGSGGTKRLYAETGESDVSIKVKIGGGDSTGILGRYTDADNYIIFVNGATYKTVAGATTLLGSGGAYTEGDTVIMRCVGSTVERWVDAGSTGAFELKASYTVPEHTAATKHGFRAGADSAARLCDYDSIEVTTA